MSQAPRKPSDPPEIPTGYRSSRRGSKALRQARRAEKQHRLLTGVKRTGRSARNLGIVILQGLAVLGVLVLVLLLAALAINTGVRWNAQRVAERDSSVAKLEDQARENLLVIGADGEEAAGFLAIRVDGEAEQVYGIAIPEGAFLDVPGQGFDRIGDAYPEGADAVLSAISNYLTVPFRSYLVVPVTVYQDALTRQVVNGVVEQSTSSNLDQTGLDALSDQLAAIPQKNVALVPLPTKPIKLGDQTYLEPQRDEVADLLKSWWRVDPSQAQQVTRIVVYNGAGTPGVAGAAAQELIRSGVRVIDTQNADSFDYATTQIVVRRGGIEQGENIQKVLGVGEVRSEPSSQDVTDVVVIIGKDYEPPSKDE